MKLLTLIVSVFAFANLAAQQVDYDDLYFNSTDRALLKTEKVKKEAEVKRKRYLPSEHQEYNYYTEFQSYKGVIHIDRLKLDPYFLLPMTVSSWTFYQVKNVHLVRPELSLGFSYKYQSRMIYMPFPYMEGLRSRYVIHWESPKVNFYLMQ